MVRGVDMERRLKSLGFMFLRGPEGCSCGGGFDRKDMFVVTSLMCGVGKGWVMCGEWRSACAVWWCDLALVGVFVWVCRHRSREGWCCSLLRAFVYGVTLREFFQDWFIFYNRRAWNANGPINRFDFLPRGKKN